MFDYKYINRTILRFKRNVGEIIKILLHYKN